MPKILREADRREVKEKMFQNTVKLIQEKGLANVTVEDITTACDMGKGSFYRHYSSKEIFFYETVKRCEREIFEKLKEYEQEPLTQKEQIISIIKDIYLSSNSVILFISHEEFEEVVYKKLPPAYMEERCLSKKSYYELILKSFHLKKRKLKFITWMYLTRCLHFVVSDRRFTYAEREEMIDIILGSIADYVLQAVCVQKSNSTFSAAV